MTRTRAGDDAGRSDEEERRHMTHAMRQRWSAVMMDNYGTPPVALASGDGAMVTDVDGNSYLDLLGGIAVNILGHRHPAVIDAVTRQMSTLGLRRREFGLQLMTRAGDDAERSDEEERR